MSFRPLLLCSLLAFALAGCGVKGPLEPPPNAAGAPQANASAPQIGNRTPETMGQATRQAGQQAWGANPEYAGGINPPDMPGDSISRPAPQPTAPQKSFFLDFLL
ncbi:LPS translocon maturation chaperone LptM [Aquabacter spiritensis]|uniref:Putative lipoprotein n=1 Tax=Aquabacter spiritensis TaxID=933073 RepID=A0A4R3LZZ9_9HYPH|nr:lipoprotein [Aquabacter spiritensis]TCT06033.1 putative lipoprotein [Aquabacter spiritensis]